MGVKNFDLPSFDEWNKTRENTIKRNVGEFNLEINIVDPMSHGVVTDYVSSVKCAIATNDTPLYKSNGPVYICEHVGIQTCELGRLHDWYDNLIHHIKSSWDEYVSTTYLTK